MEITAKYLISETFNITGKGIVLVGTITEGTIHVGDTIEFIAFDTIRKREIILVEPIRRTPPDEDKGDVGILIKSDSDFEIEELKNWNPRNVAGVIYNTRGTTF